MDAFVIFIPLLPLSASIIIGITHFSLSGQIKLLKTLRLYFSLLAVFSSFTLSVLLFIAEHFSLSTGFYTGPLWLESDLLTIPLNFYTHGFRISVLSFFLFLALFGLGFSRNMMRTESGATRYYVFSTLFYGALSLFCLAANLILNFIGLEIMMLSAYFLIGFSYDNLNAVVNATRAFVINRIGDAGFILGIALTFLWTGSLNWQDIGPVLPELQRTELNLIGLCFLIAALAKSAQFPFAPWLSRALDGPSTSSAFIINACLAHSGVLVLLMLKPLFENSELLMRLLVILGGFSALYGYFVGLTQSDYKSYIAHGTLSQLGLMFVCCGLGYWQFAAWHLGAHALLRSYQLMNAFNLVQQLAEPLPATSSSWLKRPRWAYVISLQNFWIDPIFDWALVNPSLHLSKDLAYFDEHVIDSLMGSPAPAVNALSSLAQVEEQRIGANLESEQDDFANGSGLASKLATASVWLVLWLEHRLVIRGMHEDTLKLGKHLGLVTNKIESLLLRPRYLSLLVFISLLTAF